MMEFKRCSKGHYYDPAVSDSCPQCAAEEAAASYRNETGTNYFGNVGASGGVEDYGETEPVEPMQGNAGYGTDSFYEKTQPPEHEFGADDFASANTMESYDDVTLPPNVNDIFGFSPVVGWLVCVDGPAKGSDYRIHAGYNYIGRADHMDIYIKGDQSICREKHAMIAYDMEERVFFFGPADGKSIVRINGKMVMVPAELHAYDILKIGTTKLMFVPLCGERFNWDE